MLVKIDYSHHVIVGIPDSIIKCDDNGDLPFEFDEMFEVLKIYVPEGAEIEGWEHPYGEEDEK